MSKNVFANGREISAKADGNKSIAAMPDICLSPPSPPAGPIPIPYPNFSDASKTSSGSKKVMIGKKEVGLKNKSVYKSSKGDEAATRSFGSGVVTHKISGATKHAAWSFDVKVESKNVIRVLDLTTHNHGSDPPNIALTLDAAKVTTPAPTDMNCGQLETARENAEGNDLNKPVEKGETMAAGHYKDPANQSRLMKGVSHNSMVKNSVTSGYAKGGWPMEEGNFEDKNGRKFKRKRAKGPVSMACGTNKQEHDSQSVNHAEARIIEDIIGAAKKNNVNMPPGPVGKLMLSVNHPDDNMPCPQCKKLICEAKECGLEVTLCVEGEKNEPQCGQNGEWQGLRPV